MKIWVIGRNYPTPENGMNGSFELEQAQMLARRGHEVTYLVCLFHPIKKVRKWGYVAWEENGVQVCACSYPWLPMRMFVYCDAIQHRYWKKLFKNVTQISGTPDVIHIHYPAMLGASEVLLSYQSKGTRIVATEHWTYTLNKRLNNYQKKQLMQYVNCADAFICVGDPLRNSVKELTKTDKEIFVVPNVVSDLFVPAVDLERKETFTFVAVGSLIPHKQFDGIIEAFANAFGGNPLIKLMIIGDGVQMELLRNLVREKQIEEQVKFTGTLPRQEVAKYIAEADCLVCFSRLETFGVPVIEAWACGIPAIGTNALGFLEYYTDALGYIVNHDSQINLADAMQAVVRNRKKYKKEYISEFAKEHFSEGAIYNKLLEIYR